MANDTTTEIFAIIRQRFASPYVGWEPDARICVIQRTLPLLDEVYDSFSLFRSSASAAGYHPRRAVGVVPDRSD